MFAPYPYDPGRLRHRVVVQRADIGRLPNGGEKKNWVDDFAMRVEFVNQTGREFAAAKAVNSELQHLLKGRYRDGLTADHRVRYADPKTKADRYFSIQAIVNPDELRWMVYLHCRELVGREVNT